ncbi:RES domain-containing protein [Bradyrhizobium sp. STM 3557]|uniref:RES domain-containing protein n=1 Tax=Bradyrhizobium sp. STM 3557 TaxID=578920 RepID=UPI00388D1CCF
MTKNFGWHSLKASLEAEARLFNPTVAHTLKSGLDGIRDFGTQEGRPLLVDAGPGSNIQTLYRARAFQSDEKLKAALRRPDIQLGSSQGSWRSAAGIKAGGILAFYGAMNQQTAIADVRPSAGCQVAVARFEIIRKLRLLDLTALTNLRFTKTLADFGLTGRREAAIFLRSLSGRLAQSGMPDDDPYNHLATDSMVHFLAMETTAPIDGIIFPRARAVGSPSSVVLFHKAARVEQMYVSERANISASTGRWTENGWVDDYEVLEEVHPHHRGNDRNEQGPGGAQPRAADGGSPAVPPNADQRDDSLRVLIESLTVHRVRHVDFTTDRFPVKRSRRDNKCGEIR